MPSSYVFILNVPPLIFTRFPALTPLQLFDTDELFEDTVAGAPLYAFKSNVPSEIFNIFSAWMQSIVELTVTSPPVIVMLPVPH